MRGNKTKKSEMMKYFKPIKINKKSKDKFKKFNKAKERNKYQSKSFNNNNLIKKITFIFILIILFIILRKRNKKPQKSKIKVAMCAIARKENRYIKYFIEFYKKIGYNHIYLYDNNDPEDESVDDVQVVKDGIKEGYITLINYKDIPYHPNMLSQMKAYYSCYENYNLEYDWISFFDIDEFLILQPKGITIQEFLDNPIYNDCDNIKFSWKVFTDNNQLEYQEGSPIDRFPIETKFKYENRHVKSIARGGLNYTNYKRTNNPHCIWSDIKSCTSSGKPIDSSPYIMPPDTKTSWLNHYVTKSVREFFEKKYKSKIDVDTISKSTKDYLFNYFFAVNEKTKEKIDLFNQIYHTNYQ